MQRASLPPFVLGLYNAPAFGRKLIWENHSILSVYSVYDAAASRPARCVSLFFNILVIIAAEALACWLKYPLGYCRSSTTRESRAARRNEPAPRFTRRPATQPQNIHETSAASPRLGLGRSTRHPLR